MALSTANLDAAAQLLQQGRSQPPTPIGDLPAHLQPQQIDDAMAIQDALHQRLIDADYGRLVGTKIGCTTPVMQEFLGMPHPCAGGILTAQFAVKTAALILVRFCMWGLSVRSRYNLGPRWLPATHPTPAQVSHGPWPHSSPPSRL